jgi:hypothetical protein
VSGRPATLLTSSRCARRRSSLITSPVILPTGSCWARPARHVGTLPHRLSVRPGTLTTLGVAGARRRQETTSTTRAAMKRRDHGPCRAQCIVGGHRGSAPTRRSLPRRVRRGRKGKRGLAIRAAPTSALAVPAQHHITNASKPRPPRRPAIATIDADSFRARRLRAPRRVPTLARHRSPAPATRRRRTSRAAAPPDPAA